MTILSPQFVSENLSDHLSDSFDDNLQELRGHLVWRLCLVLIVFGLLGTWFMLVQEPLSTYAAGVFTVIALLGALVQALVNRHVTFARHMLIWGLMSCLALSMAGWATPWIPFFGVVFVSAMLIGNGRLFIAGGIALTCISMNATGTRDYPLAELLTTLVLAAASSWLSAYTLFTTVHWYRGMQSRGEDLL